MLTRQLSIWWITLDFKLQTTSCPDKFFEAPSNLASSSWRTMPQLVFCILTWAQRTINRSAKSPLENFTENFKNFQISMIRFRRNSILDFFRFRLKIGSNTLSPCECKWSWKLFKCLNSMRSCVFLNCISITFNDGMHWGLTHYAAFDFSLCCSKFLCRIFNRNRQLKQTMISFELVLKLHNEIRCSQSQNW